MIKRIHFFTLFLALACFGAGKTLAQHTTPRSGHYGEYMEIVTTPKGDVYGKFDYRNEKAGDRCIFYFYGNEHDHDTTYLRLGLPGVEITSGMLVMRGPDSVTLYSEFSTGYLPFNFRKVGYGARYTKETKAIALSIVKEEKCILYSKPEPTASLKEYFTAGNFVTILQRKGPFVQVSHTDASDGITTTAWVKNSMLYESDPLAW